MKLFRYERSTTSLAPPFGLVTKKPLEHQSEGSLIGTSSINLLSIASAKTLSAAGFKCRGVWEAVNIFLGLMPFSSASFLKCTLIGGPLIGASERFFFE